MQTTKETQQQLLLLPLSSLPFRGVTRWYGVDQLGEDEVILRETPNTMSVQLHCNIPVATPPNSTKSGVIANTSSLL